VAHLSTHIPELFPPRSNDSEPTDQFAILGDLAIKEAARIEKEEDCLLDAFNNAIAASLKDVQKETDYPDYGINGLFGDDVRINNDWGISTPRINLGAQKKCDPSTRSCPTISDTPPPRGAEIGPSIAE